MMMPGRIYQAGSSSYRYSINGQEKSDELNPNLTSAQFWEYDSRLERRWNVDPLAAKTPGISVYAAFNDNGISNSDPTGASTEDWIKDKRTGKYIYRPEIHFDNTPKGYDYIGSNDNDILKDLGWYKSYPSLTSNIYGYIALDADENGKWGAGGWIHARITTSIKISPKVNTYLSGNREFEGVAVDITNNVSHTGGDFELTAGINANLIFNTKRYDAGAVKDLGVGELKVSGITTTTGKIIIPASQITRGDDFPSINVSGSLWHYDENGTGATPITHGPWDPRAEIFTHVFSSSKAHLPPPSIRLDRKL